MSALQLEQERFVGHSGFQTADIVDFRLRHLKNLRNQLQRGIIRMILVAGIKPAQLLQIFKFINLMLRLPVDIHLQRIQVFDQHILPVKLLRAGGVVILLQKRQKLFGERCGKEYRSVHDPGIVPAHFHMGDASLFVKGKTPFRRIPLHIRRSIPGTALVSVEHIVPQPVVGRKNVHVFARQHLSGAVNGGQRILAGIFRIIKQLYLILVDQVFKLLLQIPYGNGNVRDAGLMQLPDLALNHPFPEDLQQPFRCFKRKRNKAGTKSSGNDQRAVHLKLLQKIIPGSRQLIGACHTFALGNEPFLHSLLN